MDDKFEFYIIESVKDMLLYEEEDLLPLVTNPTEDNIDLIIEKLIPYLELNMCEIYNVSLLEANLLQTLKSNAKENLRNYKEMILSKLSPARFIQALKKGSEKAVKIPFNTIKQAVAAGLAKTKGAVKGEVAKRLMYASQNLKAAAEKIKK